MTNAREIAERILAETMGGYVASHSWMRGGFLDAIERVTAVLADAFAEAERRVDHQVASAEAEGARLREALIQLRADFEEVCRMAGLGHPAAAYGYRLSNAALRGEAAP